MEESTASCRAPEHTLRVSLPELFGESLVATATVDGAGRTVYVNPPLARLLAATPTDLLNQPADWLVGEGTTASFLIRSDGARIPVEATVRPLPSAGPGVRMLFFEPRGVLSMASPNPESLLTVDNLASRIGHELANMLTPLLGYIELARMDPASTSAANGDVLEPLWQISRRMLVQIQNLLLLRERPEPHLRPASIVDVLSRAVAGAKETGLLESHEVRWRPPEGSQGWKTPSEQDLLVQLFVNLLLNAAESMRSPGVVSLSLQKTDRKFIVRIVDEGVGIPPEASERIFAPLYSAKATGRGIGLGLSVARRIAERHGGTLQPAAACPTGAAMVVELSDCSA